jgi:hypothetical protein
MVNWKGFNYAAVASMRYLIRHLPGGTDKKHENLSV